ncbi:interleukin-1 beta [Alligator mississippiensis]|uniref:interleukin-1 beta n=1 Tax=Alligator mississippiensis TaxID=8496 RepID=UPI000711B450|nr:interleukin-1 beta [Alligator mississippiensis]
MAEVPDFLADQMETCSMSEECFYEADYPSTVKGYSAAPLSPGESGCGMNVQLQFTEPKTHRGFRTTVVLVVAVEKMRRMPQSPQLFSDCDLLNLFNAVFEPVPFSNCQLAYEANTSFRFHRCLSFDIQDVAQKCFFLQTPAQLVALHIQGPDAGQRVIINMALYRPQSGAQSQALVRLPVALGIKDKGLYLSCVLSGDQPMLQLEEADVKGDISGDDLQRFIFYRIQVDKITKFESASHPGWYICTSQEPNQPVGITNRLGEDLITDYNLTRPKH